MRQQAQDTLECSLCTLRHRTVANSDVTSSLTRVRESLLQMGGGRIVVLMCETPPTDLRDPVCCGHACGDQLRASEPSGLPRIAKVYPAKKTTRTKWPAAAADSWRFFLRELCLPMAVDVGCWWLGSFQAFFNFLYYFSPLVVDTSRADVLPVAWFDGEFTCGVRERCASPTKLYCIAPVGGLDSGLRRQGTPECGTHKDVRRVARVFCSENLT